MEGAPGMSQVCGHVCARVRRVSFAGILLLVASTAWAQTAAGGAGVRLTEIPATI